MVRIDSNPNGTVPVTVAMNSLCDAISLEGSSGEEALEPYDTVLLRTMSFDINGKSPGNLWVLYASEISVRTPGRSHISFHLASVRLSS